MFISFPVTCLHGWSKGCGDDVITGDGCVSLLVCQTSVDKKEMLWLGAVVVLLFNFLQHAFHLDIFVAAAGASIPCARPSPTVACWHRNKSVTRAVGGFLVIRTVSLSWVWIRRSRDSEKTTTVNRRHVSWLGRDAKELSYWLQGVKGAKDFCCLFLSCEWFVVGQEMDDKEI